MFIDILEFRVENNKKIIQKKTVMVLWCQTCGNMAKIVRKLLQKKQFVKLGLSWGKFWLLRTLGRNLHIFQDNFEFRVENKKKCLGKTVLKMWSQKFTRRNSFVPIIRQIF